RVSIHTVMRVDLVPAMVTGWRSTVSAPWPSHPRGISALITRSSYGSFGRRMLRNGFTHAASHVSASLPPSRLGVERLLSDRVKQRADPPQQAATDRDTLDNLIKIDERPQWPRKATTLLGRNVRHEHSWPRKTGALEQ